MSVLLLKITAGKSKERRKINVQTKLDFTLLWMRKDSKGVKNNFKDCKIFQNKRPDKYQEYFSLFLQG